MKINPAIGVGIGISFIVAGATTIYSELNMPEYMSTLASTISTCFSGVITSVIELFFILAKDDINITKTNG